jgi:hypothetical protein
VAPCLLAAAATSAACGSDPMPAPSASAASNAPSAPPSVGPSGPAPSDGATPTNDPASPDDPASPTPISTDPLPAGLPGPYGEDVAPAAVPTAALVPAGTEVTGRWFASTSAGDAIVVSWLVPGADPFRLERGLAAWRRFADAPAWRAVYGTVRPKRQAVLGVDALIADVTGDGSEDALAFLSTGGSGSCGTYLVVDLAAATDVFERDGCDTRIDPNADPVGVSVTEAVYRDGDPHCCPSATKVTVLAYAGGGRWKKVSATTHQT